MEEIVQKLVEAENHLKSAEDRYNLEETQQEELKLSVRRLIEAMTLLVNQK